MKLVNLTFIILDILMTYPRSNQMFAFIKYLGVVRAIELEAGVSRKSG